MAGRATQRPKVSEAVIDKILPDHAEIKVGGPAPLPRAKIEWNREKKARIARLNR